MKRIISICLMLLCASAAYAQLTPEQLAQRSKRKNLIVKEWNTDTKSKTKWLDHLTTYDDHGRKIEEVEYTTYGQKERTTCEYGPNGRIVKEVVYDDRNKPFRIRKYEYNTDGTKRKQYNYLPNGRLYSVKVFEYISADAK